VQTGAGYSDLVDELEGIAALQGRGNREVSVDLVLVPGRDEPLEPVLRWLLRDYPLVQRSVAIPLQPAPIVITAAEAQPALADLYGGADFSILEHWQPSMLDTAYARLRWVLFREARIPPGVTGAVLWVRRQPHPGSEGVGQAVPTSPEILEMPAEPLADPGEVP
jgi:hypothetical protein